MAEFFKEWLPITSALFGIITTAIGLLIPFVKNKKAIKRLKTALTIAQAVQPFIVEAEKFVHYSGEEKLAYVVTKANQYAIENKLKFEKQDVVEQIENLISLTKNVNQREKDKLAATVVDTVEITEAQ